MMNTEKAAEKVNAAVYEILTSEDDGRVCKDIPDVACKEQPGNFIRHVASLGLTKTGDGLLDPKLVLSWLLTSLGAPAFIIGLLVPVREAGALLPQLVIAPTIRAQSVRKWVWAFGSLVQGLCVMGMAFVAMTMDGAPAGWMILGLLAVLAIARSACSASYKDVLGKTVSKSTRGTATGTAGTIAATVVLAFGVILSVGILEPSVATITWVLVVSGACWIVASGVFVTLSEEPGATEGGGNALKHAIDQFSCLRTDPQLSRFIATRALLIATALAPPYFLAAVGSSEGNALGELGPFVLASGLAGMLSSYVWGRLSDKSSRQVLMLSGLLGGVALGVASILVQIIPEHAAALPLAGVLFVLVIAYQGVRLGRATHVVDMANEDTRATYTALSNTIVGVLLLIAGGFGAIATYFGISAVLGVFAVMCFGAAIVAHGLKEVQVD